jgi:glycosyltransferase involved in cell wall biosynthesis
MTCILGNSRAVLDELRAEGVPKEKLRLIYNGIDLAPFAALPTKSDARRNLSLPVDAWTMILIANIIPYKGHADLLEALSRIKTRLPNPWRLLCVGRDDGPGVALHTQARRFGIDENIVWLGLRTDVAKLLAAADLGLLVSHEEGFANAVLEGMAAALPMVVTDVGGNAEAVLDGKTGLVVPARDPERLGAAILAFAADPARAAAMGKAGRDRVEWNFSLAACVRQYEALYAELLPETDVLA